MKYTHKPIIVEAFQFPGDDDFLLPHFENWCEEHGVEIRGWDGDMVLLDYGEFSAWVIDGSYVLLPEYVEGCEEIIIVGEDEFSVRWYPEI